MRVAILTMAAVSAALVSGCEGGSSPAARGVDERGLASACAGGNLDACAVSERIRKERFAEQATEAATYGVSNSYNPMVPRSSADWRR